MTSKASAPAFTTHAQLVPQRHVTLLRNNCNGSTVRYTQSRPKSIRMVDTTSAIPKQDIRSESSQAEEKFTWTEQWYPVSFEVDINPEIPFSFTLFDQPLVLFRNNTKTNTYSVIHDECSHRLAPLSEGRLVNQSDDKVEIECAYHGWSFNECGKCTKIPQIGANGTIPQRTSIKSYETTIVGGIIWMWYGECSTADVKRLPLPPLMEEYEENELILYRNVSRIVPYSLEAQHENPLDPVHIYFAHVGAEKMYKREYGGVGNEVTIKKREKGGKMIANWKGNEIGFCPPCISYWKLSRGIELNAWFAITPMTRYTSRFFMIEISRRSRKLTLKSLLFLWKPRWMQHLLFNKTVDGDNVIVNRLERSLTNPTEWRSKCVPTNTDNFVLAMRVWMDAHRNDMPWLSSPFHVSTTEQPSRRNLLERYDSHTKYCSACSGALKNFSIAENVLGVISQICITLLAVAILVSVPAFAQSFGVMNTDPTRARIGAIVLALFLIAVLRLKSICASYIAKLTFTEESHEAYLAGY